MEALGVSWLKAAEVVTIGVVLASTSLGVVREGVDEVCDGSCVMEPGTADVSSEVTGGAIGDASPLALLVELVSPSETSLDTEVATGSSVAVIVSSKEADGRDDVKVSVLVSSVGAGMDKISVLPESGSMVVGDTGSGDVSERDTIGASVLVSTTGVGRDRASVEGGSTVEKDIEVDKSLVLETGVPGAAVEELSTSTEMAVGNVSTSTLVVETSPRVVESVTVSSKSELGVEASISADEVGADISVVKIDLSSSLVLRERLGEIPGPELEEVDIAGLCVSEIDTVGAIFDAVVSEVVISGASVVVDKSLIVNVSSKEVDVSG